MNTSNDHLLICVRFFAEIDQFFSFAMTREMKRAGLEEIRRDSKFLEYPAPIDGYSSRYTNQIYGYPAEYSVRIWSVTIYFSRDEIWILASLDEKDDEGEDSQDLYSERFRNLDEASAALPSLFKTVEKSVGSSL